MNSLARTLLLSNNLFMTKVSMNLFHFSGQSYPDDGSDYLEHVVELFKLLVHRFAFVFTVFLEDLRNDS